MGMSRIISFIGVFGGVLAVFGVIAYSLAPEDLWLVTLLEGAALVCLTLFFVTHFESVKTFSVRRSTRLGLNSLLMVALFLGILVIVNFLAARHALRWDYSETKRFTLAPQTYDVLRGLEQDVTITVFSQSGAPAFAIYRDLLDSYRQASPRLAVEYVDPERQPAQARRYGVTRTDTAVLESGARSARVSTPSEAELTAALVRVSKDAKKRIVFLQGHGEREIEDTERDGYSLAKDALVKQGYEVDTLLLLQAEEVPGDTSVLVIAGPRRAVTQPERERIARYVERGGRLLVMVDPGVESGLEELLASWGVELGRGVLVDVRDRLAQGDLTSLMIRTFTEHEITQDFNFAVLLPTSRHLSFDSERGTRWDFVPLARTSPRSWAETDLEDLEARVVNFDPAEDVQGPLPLAAALTLKDPPEDEDAQPAIVLVGNSAFASNLYVNFPGNTDFLLHAIGWLAEERALISITPKEPAFQPFIPNPNQDRLLLYVQVFLLPAVTVIWGVTVWRKRQRL